MMDFTVVLIILLQLLLAAAKHTHTVPTFFMRRYENGTLIDRRSREYNREIESLPWINKIPRKYANTIKLQASPEYVKNGEKVTVAWTGVSDPRKNDFITYNCPYYDDVNHYMDYFWSESAKGWERGYAHIDVRVYNMREPCIFRFYRKSAEENGYVLYASSNLVKFADGGPYAPVQGRIALTNNPTEMRVMWTSGAVPKPPLVRYGTTKDLPLKETAHLAHTYSRDMLCQAPANSKGFWDPGYFYDVLLTNLKPNTLYYYSYGTDDFMSKIANFTSALPKGDKTPFKFITYGDMGVSGYPQAGTTASNTRKEIGEHNIRFVYHIGDLGYAMGYSYIWEHWMSLIEPVSVLVPYMVGTGNHEYDHTDGGRGRDPSKIDQDAGWKPSWFNGGQDSRGECGVPIAQRFHMPDNGNSIFWYSFDYGLMHMVMLSTEHDFSPGSDQYKWLENDLRKVDRTVTPWLFVAGHRPMYCSQKIQGDFIVATHMQKLFEDLLYKYKVDMAFWAHYHSYERTCKVYKEKCIEDGIVHIMVGSAGMGRDGEGWMDKPWSLFQISAYGYGRVTISNSTTMKYEWIANKDGEIKDHVWLYK